MDTYKVYEFFKKKESNHRVITINEIDEIKLLDNKAVYEGVQEFFEYWNRKTNIRRVQGEEK